MQRLLTGKVRFAGFDGEWEEVRLQDVIEINYGKSPKGIQDENGKYPIFGTGGVVGNTNKPFCHEGSVIIGRKGSIDQPQLALTPYWAIDTTFYCTPKNGTDVRWLYYFLSHKGLARYNEGSTIPSLSRTTLQRLKLKMPTPKEQQIIADLFQECDLEIELQHKRVDAINQQKKGLMQRLLTGQVRVKV
jgi:type I restriction enzyme, S subunit